MRRFLPHCLLFLNAITAGPACSNYYRHMTRTTAGDDCLLALKPFISRSLYRTSVDVLGHHLSGILLMRKMPDSSIRLVFSNETGLEFFDFGFTAGDSFRVYKVIPQLNKKAVIKTLRKDFELILFRRLTEDRRFVLLDSGNRYYGFPQRKGVNYYITDSSCNRLIRMQRASARKPVMEATITLDPEKTPDSIAIRHLNFAFQIDLKKLNPGE